MGTLFTFGCTFSDEWSGVMNVSKRTLRVYFRPLGRLLHPRLREW